MYWNRTAAGVVREEMPLSSIRHTANTTTIDTVESVNPGTSTQITSTCCTVLPPPPYHNINLPLGHPSTLTNERGAPPSYEEAIDPNGMLLCSYLYFISDVVRCVVNILLMSLVAPPPSYDSLFGRMREARKVSKGIFDFLKNIIFLLLGTSKFC